ncbi:potassium channel subfamily K member 10-like [Watersipora subatra]|uniref:potassium channel subfamily K member 10-like n=1 Tax=Watersipora subatra TaxID=2589382 RepID=UPI00355BA69B
MSGKKHRQTEEDAGFEMGVREESMELSGSIKDASEKTNHTTFKEELKSEGSLTGKWLAMLLVTYLVYIILGGVIFHFIEYPYRKKTAIDPEKWIDKTLSNNSNLTREVLLSTAKEIIEMYDQGILLGSNNSNGDRNFDIGSSIFFSTTLVTTIGYGNITPISFGGRLFAVLFASVGIPLFIVTSGEFGLKLHKLCYKVSLKIGQKVRVTRYRYQITLLLVALSGYAIFSLSASIVFSVYEGWTYTQALYYTFITLTTIGLGDFYPKFAEGGDNSVSGIFYRIFVIVWILSGLVWMASIISGSSFLFRQFLLHHLSEKRSKVKQNSHQNYDTSTEN